MLESESGRLRLFKQNSSGLHFRWILCFLDLSSTSPDMHSSSQAFILLHAFIAKSCFFCFIHTGPAYRAGLQDRLTGPAYRTGLRIGLQDQLLARLWFPSFCCDSMSRLFTSSIKQRVFLLFAKDVIFFTKHVLIAWSCCIRTD